jgi:hypothetical protein
MADRKEPGRYSTVEDINPHDDVRVRILGTVVSSEDDTVTVDDGTKSVDVFVDEDSVEDIETSTRVLVLGRVLPSPDGFELQAEAFHAEPGVSEEAFKTVKRIVNTNQ